jgi:hypothetical protein
MDRMTKASNIARDVLDSLQICKSIRNIFIEEVSSPWDEKVTRLNKKGDSADVKLYLWKNNIFLYGRVYRLFLYVCDALDKTFGYDIKTVPHGTLEQKIRETYNHIWGIYVDSRVAGMGIDNFFDKTLRRNLFIDTQKDLPWRTSNILFEKLWNREVFNHPEIIDYAYNASKIAEIDRTCESNAFETEISMFLMDRTAKKRVDSIVSNNLRDLAYDIVNFTAGHCRGTLIESSYYGIYFMYDREIFAEMLTTKADALHITLFDFQSNSHKIHIVQENSKDINAIQQSIKGIYDRIANHSRLKAIKNPYAVPIER